MLHALLGNEAFKTTVQAAMQNGRLSHALLITGQPGCGRGFAARALAAEYLFPAGGNAAGAVMRCESPEFLVVAGEGKSGQIPVKRIREVRADIHHSSLSAQGRVVWIKDAHRMAAPAFNALLKVLEEPPRGALFILTAPDAAALPLTIRSRCALYPLQPLTVLECEQALVEMQKQLLPEGPQNLPRLLALLYSGRLGMGRRALENPLRLAVVNDALLFARAGAKPDKYAMLCVLAKYEGRADEDRDRREWLLEDIAAALESALFGIEAEGLPVMPPQTAAALLRQVSGAQRALQGNVSAKLAFTAMVVNMGRAVNP